MIPVPSLVVALLENLDRLGIEYAIGGSFASSAWGEPRQTNDLDIVVLMNRPHAEPLISEVGQDYLVSADDIEDALNGKEEFRSFQLLHMEEVFKIDVFLPDNDEYAQEMMARRRKYPISALYEGWFSAPEDIVISKLRWFVRGNRISDRQWNDIIRVLEGQWQTFDFGYTRSWCANFGVLAEFEEACQEVILP